MAMDVEGNTSTTVNKDVYFTTVEFTRFKSQANILVFV